MLFYIWLQVYKMATTARNQNYAWTDFEKKKQSNNVDFRCQLKHHMQLQSFRHEEFNERKPSLIYFLGSR